MSADTVITVDGSSGSGKTTLGRRLATTLGLALVDTGLVYRAVMAEAVRRGIGAADRDRLIELANTATIEINTDPSETAAWHARVNGRNVDSVLRDPAHAILLSTLSQIPEVRAALLPTQRALIAGGAVAVGRDCGTVVFPDALVKLYLEASSDVRVQRREAQLRAGGITADSGTVADDVNGRDRLDAPSMLRAETAYSIDTGKLDADAVFRAALDICVQAGLGSAGLT